MKRSRLQSNVLMGLVAITVSVSMTGCTGVLNDPSAAAAASEIVLDDDEVNKYLWKTLEDIKGNKDELTITGTCGTRLKELTIDVIPEDASSDNGTSFKIQCKASKLVALFKGSARFKANGRYKIVVSGKADDVLKTKSEVSRIYDFYKVDDPSLMVGLQCKDSIGNTAIPFENVDECSVLKTQNLQLDGTCTTEATAHLTTVTVSSTKYDCDSFSHDFSSLTTGGHLVPVTWIDPWGNTYTRTLLLKKLDTLEWIGGSVSFVGSGSTSDTHGGTLAVAMATGTPFVPVTSDVTATPIPFARLPASTTGVGDPLTVAPGFLSLVYGLESDD